MLEREFKQGDYVQDSNGNIYKVDLVDAMPTCLPYRLEAVKRNVGEITLTSSTDLTGLSGFANVGDIQWIYASKEALLSKLDEDWKGYEFLTAEDLELLDANEVRELENLGKIQYFKDEIYQDNFGNQFTVVEDCTFADAYCKVKLTQRRKTRIIVGSVFYEDNFEYAHCLKTRDMRNVIVNEDEIFMDELWLVKANNNGRLIQNTKPEDQKLAKAALLEIVKQARGLPESPESSKIEVAEPDASELSFKDRMKQKATKIKVEQILKAVEEAAERGNFEVLIPGSDNVRTELESYGLAVSCNIVKWNF
mgnify:CR=1 FL=1